MKLGLKFFYIYERAEKRLLFSVLLIIYPFFIFLVFNLFLRILMMSFCKSIVGEVEYDNIQWNKFNRVYLKKYFPLNATLIPDFKPSLFKEYKDDIPFRVIYLSRLSIFCTPYQINSDIPAFFYYSNFVISFLN